MAASEEGIEHMALAVVGGSPPENARVDTASATIVVVVADAIEHPPKGAVNNAIMMGLPCEQNIISIIAAPIYILGVSITDSVDPYKDGHGG